MLPKDSPDFPEEKEKLLELIRRAKLDQATAAWKDHVLSLLDQFLSDPVRLNDTIKVVHHILTFFKVGDIPHGDGKNTTV